MMRGQDLIKAPEGFVRVFAQRRQSPPLGTADLLDGYNHFPWIRAIADKIGQGIGSTVWQAFAGELEIAKHPLLDLLARPNPSMSGKAFFKWSGTHFTLTCEIFWLIERNMVGMPIELWPIPASWITDIPVMGNPEGMFEISMRGHRAKFPARDIIYIRDFNPGNPYGRSSSPARALGDEIESDEFAAKYVKSFFLNNARPDLLIYSKDKDNPIDKDSAKRLESTWLEKLQGMGKRFKPFFLPGQVGVHDLQSNLKDMDLIEQRKFWRDITLQVYAIPPEAMGVIENSNRASIHSAEFFLMKHVIVPKIEILEDGMTLGLASQFDNRLKVGFVSPIEEDREHRLGITTVHPYAFNLDEIREDAGREPLPNGAGELYPHAFNVLFSQRPGAGGEPAQRAVHNSKDLNSDQIEEILLVMGAIEFGPDVLLANTEAVAAFGQQIVDQVGVAVAFDIESPRVQTFLRTQSSDRIVGLVNETTRNNLRAALAEGNAAGEGAAQLAKRITAEFDAARGARAFKIARTESVRAANFGALEGMKQVGVKQKKWFTVGDSNVRATHQLLNGQTVPTNNAFTIPSTGSQAQHPGAFGIAAEDIECRCSILAVIAPESADIAIPSMKDFERERLPYERLMEYAYVKGFDAQEQLLQDALNLTLET